MAAECQGQRELSDNYFVEAAKVKHYSNQLISYWKSTIALRNRNWEHLLNQTTELRKLVEEGNFREDLPGTISEFSRGLFWTRSSLAKQSSMHGSPSP